MNSNRIQRRNVCIAATLSKKSSFTKALTLDINPDEVEIKGIYLGDSDRNHLSSESCRLVCCDLVDGIIGVLGEKKFSGLVFNLPRPEINNKLIRFDFIETDNTPSKESGEIIILLEFRKFVDRTTAVI